MVYRRHHQYVRHMKQYRETQIGQVKCKGCPFEFKCELAYGGYAICPKLCSSTTEVKVKVSQEALERLFTFRKA